MKDTCSIVANKPGCVNGIMMTFFLMFLEIKQGVEFLQDSKLLKT
jgi:hypothetical protein